MGLEMVVEGAKEFGKAVKEVAKAASTGVGYTLEGVGRFSKGALTGVGNFFKYLGGNKKSNEEDSNDIKIIKQDEMVTQNFDNSESEMIPDDEVCEEEKNGIIIYNVMEGLVMEKLDITLQKMNCCKCDRFRDDIVALALNGLKPMYIVVTKDEIESKKQEFSKLGLEVTTAVLKAVLSVRRNPRH